MYTVWKQICETVWKQSWSYVAARESGGSERKAKVELNVRVVAIKTRL